MNCHRFTPKTPLSVFATLGLSMLVATSGGALHAICKNRQVMTERQIDAAERRIGQHRLDIQIAEVRMDEMLDRFDLRDRLLQNNSSMIALAHGDIVDVGPVVPVTTGPAAVASTLQP